MLQFLQSITCMGISLKKLHANNGKKKFVTNINSAAVILVSECVYRNTSLIYKEVQCLKSKQTCAGILFQPIDQYFRLQHYNL